MSVVDYGHILHVKLRTEVSSLKEHLFKRILESYHFCTFKEIDSPGHFLLKCPVDCRRANVLFTLFVFVCVKWCSTHIVLRFCFVCLHLMVCVPYLPSFSWLSFFDLPLRYFLAFIYTWHVCSNALVFIFLKELFCFCKYRGPMVLW